MFKKRFHVVGIVKTSSASAEDSVVLSTVDAKYRSVFCLEFLFASHTIPGMWLWPCVGPRRLKTWAHHEAAPAAELCPEAIQRPVDGQSAVISGGHQAAGQQPRAGSAVQPRPDSDARQGYDREDIGEGRQVPE